MAGEGWAIHKDADKYKGKDNGPVLQGSAPGYVPASQLTPEARAKREAIAAKANRCEHGVNTVMQRCPHGCFTTRGASSKVSA